MTIDNFGKQVKKIWEDLRPVTKNMLVGVMQTNLNTSNKKFSYDIQSDWELSGLLKTLDEQSKTIKNKKKLVEMREMAEACVKVLQSQTESAEVFIQLAERAINQKNYQKLDALADSLQARFSVGEICEIIRQTDNLTIREIAQESLALQPVSALMQLINDQLYQEIIENALAQKAFEFDSEEARQMLQNIGIMDEFEEGE
jgi:hypothetical protein